MQTIGGSPNVVARRSRLGDDDARTNLDDLAAMFTISESSDAKRILITYR